MKFEGVDYWLFSLNMFIFSRLLKNNYVIFIIAKYEGH